MAFYRRMILSEWIPTILLFALWTTRGRPWSVLQLTGGTPLRLAVAFGSVLSLICLLLLQRRALLARPDHRDRAREALNFVEPLIPHTVREHRLFWLVSATAGICEEIFFRGFLPWYLSAWMGPVLAVTLAAVLFGIGHVYLGIVQVPKTAVIGFILAIVVSLSGSLWPAMLLHAVIDWNSGELGFRLLRPSEPGAGSL